MNFDQLLIPLDSALRTLSGAVTAGRPCPRVDAAVDQPALGDVERARSAAMMRVNHVGEICAQALYHAQALTTRDDALRERLLVAAREEGDHLAWTQGRLNELGGRRSVLNPFWYAGAFGIGLLAGRTGDAVSLGFIAETERQVARHLEGHLERLPAADAASRAIVAQMRDDEQAHAQMAVDSGARSLPFVIRALMKLAGRVMTTTAYRL
jgi:ubiquinone biosynthesis monooxygenase Coq7